VIINWESYANAGMNASTNAGKTVFLFLLISFAMLSSVHITSADTVSSSCSTKNLASQVDSIGHVFTGQQEINFAAASQEYRAAAAQFKTLTTSGATDIWAYDSNCKVSWNKAVVTFVMQAANASEYNLVVSEDPKLNAIYSVSISPFAYAGAISSGCTTQSTGCNWAGYAIAGDSAADLQVYESDAIWYVQTPYAPASGQSCTVAHQCEISQWDGLTNANGASIVQGGTNSRYYYNGVGYTTVYESWLAIYNDPHSFGNGCGSTASGDEMEALMENQLVHDGTSGSGYYMYLRDYSGWLCTPSSYSNPVSISFTPYYAAFEAEREEPGTYVLAGTNSMEFYDCQFALGTSTTGVWNYYNAGDGFGSSIYNNGYNETYPGTMYHNSGTYVGYFGVNYLTSNGTP
jgi:hypothetical protein